MSSKSCNVFMAKAEGRKMQAARAPYRVTQGEQWRSKRSQYARWKGVDAIYS